MAVPLGDRAQSESLGSLLLVAVVVISAATFGAYFLASATGGNGGASGVTIDASATTDRLMLSHNGGRSVPTTALRVVAEDESGEDTYAFSEGAILDGGGADGLFDPGETWELSWNQSGGTDVTVSLVDEESETLLLRVTLTVSATATDRPAKLAQGETVDGGGADGGDTATATATPATETATTTETSTATDTATNPGQGEGGGQSGGQGGGQGQ